MPNPKLKGVFLLGAALTTLAFGAWGADPQGPAATHAGTKAAASAGKEPMTDEQIISSATSAAPAKVAKAVTVVAMDADGKMRTVRKGTNGFTCMADNPATPGPDPMCMDVNASKWVEAMVGHKPPPDNMPGVMYMLEGGTDASNTDPYATKPTADNDWVKTGAHIMIVGSKDVLVGHPAGAKPDTSVPYVMWAGTPYAHLMVPVGKG